MCSWQATARRCLEAAAWELPAAIATHEEEERQRRDGLVAQFMAERYADDATARRHLEQEGWELEAAMASYMPPEPDSPVAGRSLATSSFKAAYGKATPPKVTATPSCLSNQSCGTVASHSHTHW